MEETRDKTVVEMEKTEEETKETNINYRGWKVMPFIIGNETFEKLGIIGTLSNLLIYLTTVFNMNSITAATIINVFNGTSNFGTLIAAFLCDTYFGRYKTLCVAIIACFLGSLVVQLTAAVPRLHPAPCGNETQDECRGPNPGQMMFLLTGLVLLIIGAGGIRPCNLPFGAVQFNPKTDRGKRGIGSFFNWYFFTFTFAQMISLTLIVYVQSNVSWSIGLAIPTVLMFLGCVIFFAGSKLYVKVEASGSPMVKIAQVMVVSIRKRRLEPPKQPWNALYSYIPSKFMNSKLGYTDQFRFLDRAAMMTSEDKLNDDGSASDPWNLCSMQQVEEVKCILRVIPVWISASIYYLGIIQQMTYTVFQALQSDRRIGNSTGKFQIPAASYAVFLMLGMTVFIPIYDRLLVPLLRRISGKDNGITTLQRMGIGMFVTIVSMVVSCFIERHRRSLALSDPIVGGRKGAVSSMSGLWLIPQLILAGISDALTGIGQMEFYYSQFPENMRSFSGSLYYCGLGASSYLNGFLISVVHKTTRDAPTGNWLPEDLNRGRLDYFYSMITGILVLNFGYFLVISNWYRYKGTSESSSQAEGIDQSDKNSV